MDPKWSEIPGALVDNTALSYHQIADGLNPNSPMILSNMGTAYQRKGDVGLAEHYFLRALSIDPSTAHALASLVVLYAQLGNETMSVEYLHMLERRTQVPASTFLDLARLIKSLHVEAVVDSALAIAQRKGLPTNEIEGFRTGRDQ